MKRFSLRSILVFGLLVVTPICSSAADPPTKESKPGDLRKFYTEWSSGYIDRTGNVMKPADKRIDMCCGFHEGLAAARLARFPEYYGMEETWGFVDKSGRWVVEPKYQGTQDFSEGLATVNVGGRPTSGHWDDSKSTNDSGREKVGPVAEGKWGFIDKTGKMVIKPIYAAASSFSEGLAAVSVYDEATRAHTQGYIDKSGKMVFTLPDVDPPRSYGAIHEFSEGLAIYQGDDKKYGSIDRTGKIVISPEYGWVGDFHEGRAKVFSTEDGKWGFIDKQGKMVVKPQFDDASDFSEGLAVVEVDSKFGFIDKQGKWIIPPKYLGANSFSEGLAPVTLKKRWGYIDRTGKMVIPPRFAALGLFRDGIARAANEASTSEWQLDRVKAARWGVIDKTGEYVIAPEYDVLTAIGEGMAYFEKQRKFGIKDADGKVLVKPVYEDIEGIDKEMARVRKCGKEGFINPRTGKVLIPVRFDYVYPFEEKLTIAGFGLWRAKLINKTGDVVGEASHIFIHNYSDGLALNWSYASNRDEPEKYAYVNTSGKEVIRGRYWDALDFSEGFAAVQVGTKERFPEKWVFINKKGETAFDGEFNAAKSFSDGLAAVKTLSERERKTRVAGNPAGRDEGRWGFVDKTGKHVIQPRYLRAFSFNDGVAAVRFLTDEQEEEYAGVSYIDDDVDVGRWGFIDKKGKFVVPPRYARLREYKDGLAAVQDCDKRGSPKNWGFVDEKRTQVVAARYSTVKDFSGGMAAVQVFDDEGEPGMWGFVDKTGKEVIPPKFKWVDDFRNDRAIVRLGDEYFYVDRDGKLTEWDGRRNW